MENIQEAQQLRQYLAEAIEMLDDLKPKLALFEKQRYFRFKAALHHYCETEPCVIRKSEGVSAPQGAVISRTYKL